MNVYIYIDIPSPNINKWPGLKLFASVRIISHKDWEVLKQAAPQFWKLQLTWAISMHIIWMIALELPSQCFHLQIPTKSSNWKDFPRMDVSTSRYDM